VKRSVRFLPPIAAAALLGACATGPSPAPTASVVKAAAPTGVATRPPSARPQLGYALPSGRHDCELGRQVSLQRLAADPHRLDLEWEGRRYAMTRHRSSSGLPRYEDASSQLVWIELPWKGMLLDGRSGRPLANECRPA
jgi:hypothetical protein